MATFMSWYGGKSNIMPWILSHLPPAQRLVDVFGGSGAVSFAATHSYPFIIYNDLNEDLHNLFLCLQDERLTQQVTRILSFTLYSRREYVRCRNTLKLSVSRVPNPKRAARFYYSVLSSFGSGESNGFGMNRSEKDRSQIFRNKVETFDEIAILCRHWQVENQHSLKILNAYDAPDTLFYCDPPYVHSERTGTKEYRHEMTDEDHSELIATVLSLRGMCVISGYQNSIYEVLDSAGWSRAETQKRITSKNTKGKQLDLRTEVLWMNPAAVASRPMQRDLFSIGG